ncbi:outer membrane beta-barrel protein [Carboxylicivirga sp. M1479]|uniref:outer membrane beta-barrel protein n=1 Tax=Carboxylicivirga sp. M1479 TaxID=2594476 RepID=UPI0011783F7E|nr:outer membrane beta-barrel protein [Carboxylicivirga sp. M1479]TRX70845.1 PorT family protein [Carboxylicivirga sp. M1479]
MKRGLVFSLVIVMLGFISTTQAKDGPDGKGIRAGWQSSFIAIDGVELSDESNGFYVGFFKSNNIGVSILKLDTGLEYYQVKGEKTYSLFNTQFKSELKLHYVNIPIALRVKLGPIYGLGGLSGALKVGGDYKIDGQEVDLDVSTFDAGAHLGLGVKFLMLGVEAKYNWGLVDVIEDTDSKTEYFQIGAVLFF